MHLGKSVPITSFAQPVPLLYQADPHQNSVAQSMDGCCPLPCPFSLPWDLQNCPQLQSL